MPPGRALYPKGLTRAQIEQYVASSIRRRRIRSTAATPWSSAKARNWSAFRITWSTSEFLEPAAKALRDAAALSEDAAFAKFLRLRADALLTDDYYTSDLAWLDLKDPKFDVIFAPYETYLDDLLGVKTSYGASVLIRNEHGERKAGALSEVCAGHSGCAAAGGRRPSVEARPPTPMEVMDAPFRARRSSPRLPGGGRQSAQRSAHPRGKGNEEDLLQELHGRSRE